MNLTVGQQIHYCGYPGTVVEICSGQLDGMCVVRVPGGRTCVSISELTRIRQDGKYWVLEIYSVPTKRWIVQGEHLSREAAEADLKGW
jgi:hypothetical protein